MNAPEELTAVCPYCTSDVRLNLEMEEGTTIICDNCSTPLQVVALNPPGLDYIWDDQWEEDWDEDEWYENLVDEEEVIYLDGEESDSDDWEDESNGHY